MSTAGWRAIYERFDPTLPASDPHWRVERPHSPIPGIDGALEDFGLQRVLVMGSTGTGKTTELLGLAARQPGHRRVVYFDVYDHFSLRIGEVGAMERMQPWELLMLVGFALLRAGRHYQIDLSAPAEVFQGAVAPFLPEPERARLDVGALAEATVVAVAGALGPGVGIVAGFLQKLASAVDWTIPVGSAGGTTPMPLVADQDPTVRNLLGAVNALAVGLGRVESPVLLILDGLDRLQTSEAAQRLFTNSQLLGRFECHTVICGPLSLRMRGQVGLARFDARVIPEVPVLRKGAPREPDPRGIAFFVELWARRAAELSALIPPAEVERLGYYSGGRVREFMRLVREVCKQARQSANASPAQVDSALDLHRQEVVEAGLNNTVALQVLRLALDTGTLDGERPDVVEHLLLTHRILPYPDGSEWYSPHPLLFRGLLRPG